MNKKLEVWLLTRSRKKIELRKSSEKKNFMILRIHGSQERAPKMSIRASGAAAVIHT